MCALCKVEPETVDHLFFRCSTTRTLWNRIRNASSLGTDEYELDRTLVLMAQKCRGKSFQDQIRRLMFVVTVYHTWRIRNEAIFEQKHTSTDAVFSTICDTVRQASATWRGVQRTKQNWMISLQLRLSQKIFVTIQIDCKQYVTGRISWWASPCV